MATEETTITELELAEEVLADMVIPVDTLTDTKSVSLKQLRAWLGSSLPTGFILPAVGKIDDERFSLLDGKTLSKQGTYGAFCVKVEEQVQASNWFACSEEEYNADLLAYGQCGKFVIGTDYVRIPTITRFIGATITLSEIGKTYKESLPSIKVKTTGSGNSNSMWHKNLTVDKTGLARGDGEKVGANGSSSEISSILTSADNPVYQDGAKVQPDHTKFPYYMVISTEGQTAEVQIDINKVYEDLNLKANNDLSNVASVASSFKEASVGWGMPDYSAGVTKTKDVNYTETVDGFVVVNVAGASYNNFFYLADYSFNLTTQGGYSHGVLATFYVPKGTLYKYSGVNPNKYIFFPLKGVN